MAITAERMAEIRSMLSGSAPQQQASAPARWSTGMSPERKAEIQRMLGGGSGAANVQRPVQLTSPRQEGVRGIPGAAIGFGKKLITKGLDTAQAGINIGDALGGSPIGKAFGNVVTGGMSDEQKRRLGQNVRSADSFVKGTARVPEPLKPIGQAERTGATVEQIAEFLVPGVGATKFAGKGAQLIPKLGKAAPIVGRGIEEAVTGAGIGLSQTGDLAGAGKGSLIDFGLTTTLGAAGKGLGALGKAVAPLASKTSSNVPGMIGGTSRFARGIGRTVSERVTNLSNSIADGVQNAAARADLPSVERQVENSGVAKRFVNRLKTSSRDTVVKIKETLEAGKQALEGKKVDHLAVQGRAALDRFDIVQRGRKTVGQRMEDVIDDISANAYDVRGIREEARDIVEAYKGKITLGERLALNKILKEIPRANTMSARGLADLNSRLAKAAREIVALRKLSPGTVSMLVAKIRDAISSQLPAEYRALSKQYAEMSSVIDNFLREIGATKKDGVFYTLDDLMEEGEGLVGQKIIRLITNASGSRSMLYGKLDELAKKFGYQGADDLETIAEWTDIIENALGLTKQGSLQGRMSSGIDAVSDIQVGSQAAGPAGGVVLGALSKAVGAAKVDRQRAIEDFLESLLR